MDTLTADYVVFCHESSTMDLTIAVKVHKYSFHSYDWVWKRSVASTECPKKRFMFYCKRRSYLKQIGSVGEYLSPGFSEKASLKPVSAATETS